MTATAPWVPRISYLLSDYLTIDSICCQRIERSMTYNRQKHRAFVAAIVAAVLVLPAPVIAQTAPAATTPSPTVPQAAPTRAAPAPSAASSAAPATPATDPAAAPGAVPPAVDTSATPPAANSPNIALKLPRDLSPWGMFMAADIVVKAVMVGLAFASVLTWTIWFAKAIELMFARRRMRTAIEKLAHAKSWSEANVRTKGRDVGVAAMLRATDTELRMSADAHSASGIKERIASRLERLEAAAGRQMIRGTGILATIGATAPFVGPVRHGVGHHEQLHRHLEVAHHQSCGRGTWHCRGIAGDRARPRRCNPRSRHVQHVLTLDRRLSRLARRRCCRNTSDRQPRS